MPIRTLPPSSSIFLTYNINFKDLLHESISPNIIEPSEQVLNSKTSPQEEDIKHVSRFKFSVSHQFLEQLQKLIPNPTYRRFVDYYYYPECMENNTWVKKRVEGEKEEWIVKHSIESKNDFQFIEEKYEQNPFSEPLHLVAECTVNRRSYAFGDSNSQHDSIVNIDRVAFPEGDLFCCGSFDNYSTSEILPMLVQYVKIPSRSTLFEYLYRYNPNLYEKIEPSCLTADYGTCVLKEQYEEMEKLGDDKYYRLLDIIKGINWYSAKELQAMNDEMNEMYKDYTE